MPVILHKKTDFPEETLPRVMFAIGMDFKRSCPIDDDIVAYVMVEKNGELLWMPTAEAIAWIDARGGRIWNALLVKPLDPNPLRYRWGIRADGKNLRSLTLEEVYFPLDPKEEMVPAGGSLRRKISLLTMYLLADKNFFDKPTRT